MVWQDVGRRIESQRNGQQLSVRRVVHVGDVLRGSREANSTGKPSTLVEQWDGRHWSVVRSPDQGASTNQLYSIACVKSAFCEAAGLYYDGSVFRTLVLKWTGGAWSVDHTPNAGSNDNELYGVTCPNMSTCVLAGDASAPDMRSRTLVETGH